MRMSETISEKLRWRRRSGTAPTHYSSNISAPRREEEFQEAKKQVTKIALFRLNEILEVH